MNQYTVYDDQGNIVRTGYTFGDIREKGKNVLPIRAPHPKRQRVENGLLVYKSGAEFERQEFERELRSLRDARLRATDYLVMPDYPITPAQRERVAAYRQALRDLPAQYEDETDISKVNFPKEP